MTGIHIHPGNYVVAVIAYDGTTGRENLWRERLRVPPLKNDPLKAPASDEQKNRYAQLLLANDDGVAGLRQQVAEKQLTNVEDDRRLQELAKARNNILARYDRTGQRELVALYNAAVKDRRAEALEAKRKADAEARAQALADAQAKRAADQEAAGKAAEDDAREYMRLALRHDELLHKLNMKRLTDEERKEMAAQVPAVHEGTHPAPGKTLSSGRKRARGGGLFEVSRASVY